MGYGSCVVTSDIPECLEIIKDCGVSFRTGDYADLKQKLKYLFDNPFLVSHIGAKAISQVEEHYNWKKIFLELDRVYSELISKK